MVPKAKMRIDQERNGRITPVCSGRRPFLRGRALVLISVGVACIQLITVQSAIASNVTLYEGSILFGGESLNTGTGCQLDVQSSDGNVVEYCNGSVVWNSESEGNAGDYLYMQSDGNLVIYTSSGHPIWSTATNSSRSVLTLQDDHNLVVYWNSTALWAVTWTQNASGAQTYADDEVALHYANWASDPNWGSCLYNLWQNESGWSWSATNPSSGAYGIPQDLHPNTMAPYGTDWHDDGLTQVQWGLNYINQTYSGDPCTAWAFWNNHNPHYY